MVPVVKKVPPFFDSNLPAAGSVISSQVERSTTPLSTTLLTFQTELSPISPVSPISPIFRSQTPLLRRSPTPSPLISKIIKRQVRFKCKKGKSVSTRTTTPESMDPSSNSDSDSDSDSTLSTSTDSSDSGKIPKPEGEPGRPGRGGYNLERAVNWATKDYKHLKKYVHQLVDVYLDVSSAYSGQSLANLKKLLDKTQSKFPQLEQYVQCWPVTDLIRMRLKYTSGRERRLKAFRVAEDIAQAASKTVSTPKLPLKAHSKVKKLSLKKGE